MKSAADSTLENGPHKSHYYSWQKTWIYPSSSKSPHGQSACQEKGRVREKVTEALKTWGCSPADTSFASVSLGQISETCCKTSGRKPTFKSCFSSDARSLSFSEVTARCHYEQTVFRVLTAGWTKQKTCSQDLICGLMVQTGSFLSTIICKSH